MAIKKVALVGTRGRLGPWLLKALANSNKFEVTVLLRPESAGSLPAEYKDRVQIQVLPGDFVDDENKVAELLKGIDAVVMAMPAFMMREHQAIMNAAIKARVRRFVPADYGSVDSSDPVCTDLIPKTYGAKKHMRDILRGISMMYPNFSWTSIVCGHFFDYGLEEPLLGFDLSKDPPTALILDDGNQKWSASTRDRIGEALVAALEKEQESENRMVYVQSFCVTQNQVLEVLERVSGKKFEVTKVGSEEYIKQKKHEMDNGIGQDPAEELVFALGLTRADWTEKKDFVNEAWGLNEESLEEEVRRGWLAKTQSRASS